MMLGAYRAATTALGPFAGAWLDARARRGKEDSARIGERFGRYAQQRPVGKLIWLHAASVGESGVALMLIDALTARDPTLSFLLSTGTRTSAELVSRRANAHTTHIYAPLDRADAVARFFQHWRPDLGVFLESELWPNLILGAETAGVRLALINARMSPSSLRRWRSWPAAGKRLLRAFAYASAADARTAEALSALRDAPVATAGNLKLAAPAPAVDAAARAALATEIGARPVWLAASTHAGEDQILIDAHMKLTARRWRDALLIIAPRHPERGAAIGALHGHAPQRSRGAAISQASLYVADTLGELGTLYDLASVAFIAGSLLPELKGHNPIEAAKLGSAILTGPHVESFGDVYAALIAAGGATVAGDADAIATRVEALWNDEALRQRSVVAARATVSGGEAALEDTVTRLLALAPLTAQERAHAPT